jgi:phosphoribosylformimino-5-aminoimidazole carboxamide ribotide isomerase
MTLTLYPAIDLRDGQVVRLKHGDPEQQTVFGDDPVAIAGQWVEAGATWLHVVNLDGAFDEAGLRNWQLLPRLTETGARVQFGGGIRTLKDVAGALSQGASRVILGTVAVEEPDIVQDAVRHFGPERVAVGIDALDGLVKVRGWQGETVKSPLILGLQMMALGVRTVIYTDISRDGVLTGVNAQATAELARNTGLNLIASGGVASLEDVRRVLAVSADGVSGLIIGRALYEGKIDLREALETVSGYQ